MSCNYANIVLHGVTQDELIEYLSKLGCESYVSPTVNGFTVMHDISFDFNVNDYSSLEFDNSDPVTGLSFDFTFNFGIWRVWILTRDDYREYVKYLNTSLSKQRYKYDLTRLSPPKSANILTQYEGQPEGKLVCWASHLSETFSCAALAFFMRDDTKFWYHLSLNGNMLDEYILVMVDILIKPINSRIDEIDYLSFIGTQENPFSADSLNYLITQIDFADVVRYISVNSFLTTEQFENLQRNKTLIIMEDED